MTLKRQKAILNLFNNFDFVPYKIVNFESLANGEFLLYILKLLYLYLY